MPEAAKLLPMEAVAALRLRTSHWARSQEPRILCNKIIVHIDIILYNTMPIVIEYDDPHLLELFLPFS